MINFFEFYSVHIPQNIVASVALILLLSSNTYGITFVDIFGETNYVTYRDSTEIYNVHEESMNLYPGVSIQMNTNYYNADLSYADLSNSIFNNMSFRMVDFSNAILTNSTFNGSSNLEQIDWSNADLKEVDFGSSSIWYSNFDGADLSYADLSIVQSAGLANWTNANLYGATLPTGYDQAWFESEGAIFVVPEPSTYALILGALVLGFVASRRR